MSYLGKKLLRDLWKMKFQSTLIILSVGFAVGLYGGLLLVKDNAFASRDDIMEKTSYEDVRFRFFGFEDEGEITSLIENSSIVEVYDIRLSLDIVLQVGNKSFPGLLHGVHGDRPLRVNGFLEQEGDYFGGEVNQTDSLVIEKRFADYNDLTIGDKVAVKVGGWNLNLSIAEVAFSPEHMYNMNPNSGLPERGNFATVWYSLDALITRLEVPYVVNELLIRFRPGVEIKDGTQEIAKLLSARGYSAQPIYGDEEIDYNMMTQDIGTMDEISVALGAIILLVAAFVIYDTVVKLITNQRTQIGVIMALGGTSYSLIAHYSAYGVILTLLGIMVGVPIGYVITYASTDVFVSALGIAPISTVFRLGTFLPSIVMSIAVALIAGIVSSTKITSLSPVDAITNQKLAQGFNRRSRFEGVFDKLFPLKKFTVKIPVRNVFLRKRRSLMTAFTIALAAIVILSSSGFLDSFFNQIDVFYSDNYRYDMEVSFSNPVTEAFAKSQIEDIQGIEAYEGIVKQPVYVVGPSGNGSSILFAYQSNSSMRKYTFEQGSLVPGQIAIGQILARKLGVGLGDEVTIFTMGKTVFTTIERKYVVSGITKEFVDQFVFMDLNSLQQDFLYGSSVNALAIKVKGDTEVIKNKLFASRLPVNSITDLKSTKESFVTIMEAVIAFADFIKLMGVIVLLLFSLNVVVLDVMERRREFVNIRVNGGDIKEVTRIIAVQIGLITLAVVVIDYFIHPFFTTFIIDSSLKDMIYVAFYMNPASYWISLFLLLAGIGIGVVMAVRETLKLNIVEEIRLRFKN